MLKERHVDVGLQLYGGPAVHWTAEFTSLGETTQNNMCAKGLYLRIQNVGHRGFMSEDKLPNVMNVVNCFHQVVTSLLQ